MRPRRARPPGVHLPQNLIRPRLSRERPCRLPPPRRLVRQSRTEIVALTLRSAHWQHRHEAVCGCRPQGRRYIDVPWPSRSRTSGQVLAMPEHGRDARPWHIWRTAVSAVPGHRQECLCYVAGRAGRIPCGPRRHFPLVARPHYPVSLSAVEARTMKGFVGPKGTRPSGAERRLTPGPNAPRRHGGFGASATSRPCSNVPWPSRSRTSGQVLAMPGHGREQKYFAQRRKGAREHEFIWRRPKLRFRGAGSP
jgi:hypothetical protein